MADRDHGLAASGRGASQVVGRGAGGEPLVGFRVEPGRLGDRDGRLARPQQRAGEHCLGLFGGEAGADLARRAAPAGMLAIDLSE